MALNLRKCHVYEKVGKRQELQLVAEHHVVRVRNGDNGPLFVQDGQVWSEGGEAISPIPDWFWVEYRKVSPEMRKEVKLALPEEVEMIKTWVKTEVKPGLEVTSDPPKTKECPECLRMVKVTAFGLHIARHRKAEKVA